MIPVDLPQSRENGKHRPRKYKTKLIAIVATAGVVAGGFLAYRQPSQKEPPPAGVAAAVSPKEEPQAPAPPEAAPPPPGPARIRQGVDLDRLRETGPFIRWRYPISNKLWGYSMKGGTLFFKDHPGAVHAIDTGTGEALWVRKIDSMFVKGALREVGDSVYLLVKDRLFAFDRATGETRADVPYDTEFSDRAKWNYRHTLYVDAEERGAVAFCGPGFEKGSSDYHVEVVYFDLKTSQSRMRRMSGRWGNFVGGPYEDSVWYATGLRRDGLDASQVHAIRLSDGGTTVLPRDAPQWGMSSQEIREASAEIYRYGWSYFPSEGHGDGCVYLWKNGNTLEKRTEEGEFLWAHTSQEASPSFVGVSPAGPIICGFNTAVYCVSEGPAPANERAVEEF